MGLRKLLVVYNPSSSQHVLVESEVLAAVRKVKGFLVGKFEVGTNENVTENAARLAKMIGDGDLVIAAGGDGTATIALNALMKAGKRATMAVMGYGNFNDMAGALGARRPVAYGDDYLGGVADVVERYNGGMIEDFYPLEVLVDGKLWRYAPCYFTMGLFAEATTVFDDEKVRKKLQKKQGSLMTSWLVLAKWYFRNKGRKFLPSMRLNGEELPAGTTDYVAMNSTQMARVMKGRAWYKRPRTFGSATARLGKFAHLVSLMSKSIFAHVPTAETEGDVLEFDEEFEVMLHAEGEYEKRVARKIEVKKAGRAVKVVKF